MRQSISKALRKSHSRVRSRSRPRQAPVSDYTDTHINNTDRNVEYRSGRSLLPHRSRRTSNRQPSDEGSSSARKRTWSRGRRQKTFNSDFDPSDSEGGQSTLKNRLHFWHKSDRGTPSSANNGTAANSTPSTRNSPSGYHLNLPYTKVPGELLYSGLGPQEYGRDGSYEPYLKSADQSDSMVPTAANTEESRVTESISRPLDAKPTLRQSPGTDNEPFAPAESLSSYHIPPAKRHCLSTIGTPIDLTEFFYPRKWTAQRYRVISTIAPAIHGEVRYVLDMRENKAVVVKVIRNAAVRPREQGELENPLVEIGAMTYLHSREARYPVDLIARLNGVYQDAEYTYLVTEYCSGGELFRLVVDRKCFNESFVKAIALQLALALLSLHKNGICHRDVSLENTLLKQDKTVRLIDFGQAEAIFDASGRERYMSGSAGKDYYRAPEMMRGRYRGPPVDVFALGVEIFIMAIGSPPWQEASDNDPRYRSLTQRGDALDISLRKWGKRDSVSDAFVDMLAWIFCATPNKRPSIEDLLLHPWFALDPTVWRWVYNKGHSVTIRAQAERLDAYLRTRPAEFFYQGQYKHSGRYPIRSEHWDGILRSVEPRRRDEERSATRHRRPYA